MKTNALPGLFLFLIFSLSACKSGQTEKTAVTAVGVRINQVGTSEYISPVRCTGKLSSKTESKLSFKTGGIIYRILADEGQSVKKGQLLAELNLEEIRSQVRQAELIVNKASRDFKRAENLYRDSVVTLEQFENAQTALEVASSNARIARFNMKYSAIHAPTDGKILKRIAEKNEIIAPGYPVFLFASTQNEWVVRANLTDIDVIRIHMLDSARIFFDAYRDQVFMGLVSEIGNASDPYSGTYEVEIQLLRKPEKLVSGFIARIEIYPAGKEQKIVIPYEAVLDAVGFTAYVYVVDNGSPFRRKIHISSFNDQGVVVESGLESGEQIVIEGAQYLREDSPIEIIKAQKQ